MTVKEAAARLEHFALLLELLGEDEFRAKAFAGAARNLEVESGELGEFISSGRVGSVRGVGKTVAAALRELLAQGTFDDLKQASERVPPGVLELLRVEGLGPKKARALWIEGKIESLDELERAIHENRVQKISGFGAKTADKFLASIAYLCQIAGRHLRHHALRSAGRLRDLISNVPGVQSVIFGGSIARGNETIRDIDLLIVTEDRNLISVRSEIRSLGEIQWLQTEHELWSGQFEKFEVECSVVPIQEEAARRLLFTGSKSHYTAMQVHAARSGFRLAFDRLETADGREISVESDLDIYRALGLEPVPPALREDESSLHPLGSIKFPPPVATTDFRGILHCHTTYSDGLNTLRQMTEAMIARGYSFVGIADHSKSAVYAQGLTEERVRKQWEEIDALNHEFRPFRILKGTEVDILPDGTLDFEDPLLSGFDFVVASIHSGFSMTEEQATTRLCRALENPHVDILGHPTGRLLLKRPGYPVNHEQLIETASKHGKAIELNCDPHRLDIDWRWISHCIAAGVPVPINPDAHDIESLDYIQYGTDVAAKAPLTKEHCPSTWAADKFADWCSKHGN